MTSGSVVRSIAVLTSFQDCSSSKWLCLQQQGHLNEEFAGSTQS